MSFVPLKPEHKTLFDNLTDADDPLCSRFNFEMAYIESQLFETQMEIMENGFVMRKYINNKWQYFAPFPTSKNDVETLFERYRQYEGIVTHIEPKYVPSFERLGLKPVLNRDMFEYVYLTEKLASLSGKKLHSKRNFVNRFFSERPEAVLVEYSADHYAGCLELLEKWEKENGQKLAYDETLLNKFSLENHRSLGLTVYVLEIQKQVIGFDILKINRNTANFFYEKCDTSFVGSYQALNYLVANKLSGKVRYVNRQEDLGIEGLRKAKLSYYPEVLLEKYSLELS
jgi:hypothetical protein